MLPLISGYQKENDHRIRGTLHKSSVPLFTVSELISFKWIGVRVYGSVLLS